ncbi:UPF0147 family protein [Candidatus Woesearchaeota archaeon]|nr:UPF0147 family protein [Candidatus Woesearchaeota archaeon]
MSCTEFSMILRLLQELAEDSTIPKNVRITVQSVMQLVSRNEEPRMAASKALQELESLTEINVEPFTRSQIFNIVSMLESVK